MDRNYGLLWWRHYLALSGPQCAYCLRDVAWAALTRDHIVPRSRGGADSPANVLPACESCNVKKSSLTLKRFLQTKGRRGPQENSPVHALGQIVAGVWVWSAAALAVQDAEQRRAHSYSAALVRVPPVLHKPVAQAEIEMVRQFAEALGSYRLDTDPAPVPAKLKRRTRWWQQYLTLADGRCTVCRQQGSEPLQRRLLKRKLGRRPENSLPTCPSCLQRPLRSDHAEPHALGEFVGGEWLWSPAALAVQAAYDSRVQLISA